LLVKISRYAKSEASFIRKAGEDILTKRQVKIILIDYISWFCKWTRKELREWDEVFKKLDLKGV